MFYTDRHRYIIFFEIHIMLMQSREGSTGRNFRRKSSPIKNRLSKLESINTGIDSLGPVLQTLVANQFKRLLLIPGHFLL